MSESLVFEHRIGIDENGLGSRLGPLIVTAVLARVDSAGRALLGRKLPARIAEDLGDSKALVSHADYRLGEAWARALLDDDVHSPAQLLAALALGGIGPLQELCPPSAITQCWGAVPDAFSAEAEWVERLRGHRAELAQRGVMIRGVKSRVVCTRQLNVERARGISRFSVDLHSMEHLILALRQTAGTEVEAICGKVGGIGDYARFFGPLSGRLQVELRRERAHSAYRFPGLGELHFVMDADDSDPLVMLASLVGKYLRELLMGNIGRHYIEGLGGQGLPSGYHDPVTQRFVTRTAAMRKKQGIPDTCFEREKA